MTDDGTPTICHCCFPDHGPDCPDPNLRKPAPAPAGDAPGWLERAWVELFGGDAQRDPG